MCEYCGSDYLYKISVCFFSITNTDIEKIHREYKGSISNFLNISLHESLILEFVMILITGLTLPLRKYYAIVGVNVILHLYRCTVHFAESLYRHTNQCTHLNDDDRMIETCRSIFKSFNVNSLSVCIGWCADQVILQFLYTP